MDKGFVQVPLPPLFFSILCYENREDTKSNQSPFPSLAEA